MMRDQPETAHRRTLLAAFFLGIAVVACIYAVTVAIADGIKSAGLPIVLAVVFGINYIWFLRMSRV
jgi:hypothetical protein